MVLPHLPCLRYALLHDAILTCIHLWSMGMRKSPQCNKHNSTVAVKLTFKSVKAFKLFAHLLQLVVALSDFLCPVFSLLCNLIIHSL